MTYDLFASATSSPESASGQSQPDLQAGKTTRRYGRDPALASLSARQAKAAALMTSGTSGPHSTISSSNAILRSRLASKLRELTETLGSTLYRLTWMQRDMASGLRKPSLRASARPTSEPGIIGWPTASARDWKDSPGMATTGINPDGSERTRLDMLPRVAHLAGWPTSQARDGDGRGGMEERTGGQRRNLDDYVTLAGWATPVATELGNTLENYQAMKANMKSGPRTAITHPSIQAQLCGWPTPNTMTGGQTSRSGDRIGEPLIAGCADLCGWPTPTVSEATAGARPADAKRGPAPGMHETVKLAGWTTPTESDSAGAARATTTTGKSHAGSTLVDLSRLSGWPTPMAGSPGTEKYNASTSTDSSRQTEALAGRPIAGHNLDLPSAWSGPARLTVSGETLIGFAAGTKSGGQLSPAHSLWLMLGPFGTAWASCGERVTRSRSGKRSASSKRSKLPSGE